MTCGVVAQASKQEIVIWSLLKSEKRRVPGSSIHCYCWLCLISFQDCRFNGTREDVVSHRGAMIVQMRLLCRHRVIPTALPCQWQYAPTVCRRPHTTAVPGKSIVTPARGLRRLPGRLMPPLGNGSHRNASFDAGENESGHINAGPNEGIFFFDSESIQ
jgi:hypothetical protein